MDYYDVFKELLTVLIDKGKGIEVNTGSMYKGFSYPHPHQTVFKMYHANKTQSNYFSHRPQN